jgi:hypothetical protein
MTPPVWTKGFRQPARAADWERLSNAITQVVRLEEAATCAA